ncbi:hypothetical protein QUB75_25170 [Microcoleus sp. K1-B6]|uniref:hypothetical protein n=1 Tax=unclassified Microcoleus TaxID=2642155 RepID=UPI002FCF12B3
MQHTSKNRNTFLTVTLESAHRDSNLDQIQIIGVPGQNQNGKNILSDTVSYFFDDLIGRPIFAASRRIPNLDWQKLTIWLYPRGEDKDSLEYQVPKVDNLDLKIKSNISESNLKFIYVLDNDLKGSEYRRWQKTSEDIFTPLFKKFVAPPELPQLPFSLPFSLPFIESLDSRLDPYAKMKRELFFDALIIQVD